MKYLGHLVAEMLRAGFVVMRLIYTRGRKMEPKLIWFDTTLKTGLSQAILADSITLDRRNDHRSGGGWPLFGPHPGQEPGRRIEDCEFQRRLEKLEA